MARRGARGRRRRARRRGRRRGEFAQRTASQLATPVIVKYRDARTDAATALESALRIDVGSASRIGALEALRRSGDRAKARRRTPSRSASASRPGICPSRLAARSRRRRVGAACCYGPNARAAASCAAAIAAPRRDPERGDGDLRRRGRALRALLAFVGPGDEVLIPDPGYPGVRTAGPALRRRGAAYPLAGGGSGRVRVRAASGCRRGDHRADAGARAWC